MSHVHSVWFSFLCFYSPALLVSIVFDKLAPNLFQFSLITFPVFIILVFSSVPLSCIEVMRSCILRCFALGFIIKESILDYPSQCASS